MDAEVRLLDLIGAMEDLKAVRNRVLREIESEEVKGKQRTQNVQVWLDKVVDIDRRTNQLIIEFGRCCVTGCCSLNVYSRLNASRKATKLEKEIDELMKEKVHLCVLAKRRLSSPVIDMPISSTNVGIMIESNLRIVRDCLADKTFGIIGIYGMGGIGKTTLLKEIKRSIGDWNMGFDYVIHARASYELHVEDLRDCIAEQLPLCEPSSRETIFKFLKYKNFLLLLDDLWEELDITVLGIPDPHDESDATTLYKRKVVFTTRSKQVCDCMKADKKIKLECLDKDEGWQLFKENLAMDLEGMHSIEKAAREVANLCGGLPLALIMVGRAMSNKTSTTEWNFILDQLRGSLSSSLCESMFLYLRSSYDSLANKTLQQCFLCFCLWPKKKLISTEDLVKCWLGFGLISCFDSLSEAYMHGCYILQILEEASLVVTHGNKRVAKVHEIIHDMAQWIALGVGGGSHKPWFVRQNITLKQLSLEEVQTWSQLERVSVVKRDINCLPELQFECPSLLSLNIQHNERLENLPKIFFQQMPNLTYLNLSFTGICELPTVIMDLCNLEFLDISCTRIISLPNKLGNLKKLKYLFCRYLFLDKLRFDLLSSLHSLQVLDIYPYGCVVPQALGILRGLKGVGLCASSNYILEQLSDLPIININIRHINGFSTLHFGSLTSEEHGGLKELQISFSVAIQNLVIDNKTSLKLLRLNQLQNLGSFVWGIEPKEIFPMLQLVKIEACSSLASLHWVLHLPLLRALVLKDCYTMKELVNGEEREEIKEDDAITTFPKLKYLTIVHLPKLVTISSCALDFPHLSEVHLEDCPNLKRLPFKPDIVNNQGLLIKCESKWWESLEWDDATVRSQFCSNSTEDKEIAEFFVGNVPTEDEEIAEFFVGNVSRLGHKDPRRKSRLHKVGQKDERVKQLKDEDKEGFCVPGTSNEITQLEGDQSQVSLRDVQLPKLVSASYKAVGKGIALNLDIARSYLADETVKMVGIWGMGGVGKTTLLQQIYNSLLDEGNMGFDHVLWVVASQNVQLGKLKVEIAKKLQLASSAGKEDICNVLKTKNFVLLLDDLWDGIDLRELGVPVPHRTDDNSTKQYKHKVIFTTRSKIVCSRMGVSKSIKLECLEPDEAWDLFKDTIDLDVIESDERIYEIAQQVMNKCGGLPLALKVIGKAISNKKTLEEWEFILKSIKNSNIKDDQGVEGSIFASLKYSYDNLPNRIKECFLCVSMLREPSKGELLECWMGLGLIGDFVYIQQAYNEAEYILKILEESCLLYVSVDGHVQLHDVIYDMAMWIVSDYGENRNKWIVKEYDWLADKATNDTENWRSANRVVIYGIKLLPVLSHPCYDLLCLMINSRYYLKNIPEGFFGQMPKLIYLDLSHTGIKELPKDIKRLVNLQYLNISYTEISSLPKELVRLKKLQYLICRYSAGLRQVKKGLISRFQKLKVIDLYPYGSVQLEELKILGKHIKAIGMRVGSEEVLQQLSCLPTTQLSIRRLDSVTSLSFDTLSCKNHGFLQKLNIQSCPQLDQIVMNGSETHLKYLKISHVKKLQNIIWRDIRPPEFFHTLNWLHISYCNLDNLAWVLHLPCLFYLRIWHCANMETLFYIKEETEIQQVSVHPTFPALRFLILGGLPKLMSISNSALDSPQLSKLAVIYCRNVKKLPFKRGINNNKKININCAREWWEELEWDDDAASPSQLSPYCYSTTFFPGTTT